jgi:hypothetical protein
MADMFTSTFDISVGNYIIHRYIEYNGGYKSIDISDISMNMSTSTIDISDISVDMSTLTFDISVGINYIIHRYIGYIDG